MAAPAPVTTIGPAFWYMLFPSEMNRPRPSIARTKIDLYVIDKI